MSWSVSAIGKPAAVAAKVKEQLASIKCNQPEEAIKNSVADIVDVALAAFPEGYAVKVEASGSQSSGSGEGKAVNQLSVKIDPLWGFLE